MGLPAHDPVGHPGPRVRCRDGHCGLLSAGVRRADPRPIRSLAPGETATPSSERPSLPTPSPSPEAVAEGATFALPKETLGAAPDRIEALARWGTEGVPAGAILSPDEARILFSVGNTAKWLDAITLQPVHELAIPVGDQILQAAFSPDGRWFALGTEQGRIYLGSSSGPAIVRSVQAPGASVESLAFSPDSRYLAAGWLGGIGLWEIPVLTPRWTFPLQDRKATMRIERENGLTEWTFVLNIRVFSVQFSPDGTQLAAGTSAGAVYLLDPRTGEERRRLEPGSEWIVSVVWSPDGSFLAAGGSDGRIFLWREAASQAPRWLASGPGDRPPLLPRWPLSPLRQHRSNRPFLVAPGRNGTGPVCGFDRLGGQRPADAGGTPAGLVF